MPRLSYPCAILVSAFLALALPSFSQESNLSPEAEEKIPFAWTDARIETVTAAAIEASKGRLSILCDSYDADSTRGTQAAFRDTPGNIAQRIARGFERQLIRRNGFHLIRHDRWFDLRFAMQPANSRERKPAKRGAIRVSRSGKTLQLDVDLMRLPLQELALQLKSATQTPHSVALPFRVRRVSGRLTAITPQNLRELIASLYPDSEWKLKAGTWYLVERESAEITRALAAEGASHTGYEMRPRAALFAQAASELNDEQLRKLENDGRLRVSWSELSNTSRDLLQQWGTVFLDVVDRSDKNRDYFLDFNRKETWGVEIRQGADGSIKANAFGRTPAGPLVVF